MNNKLPIEIKEKNPFNKVLNFIKNIFKKQKLDDVKTNEEVVTTEDLNNQMESFIKYTEYKTSKNKTKRETLEEIIKIIEKKPELLENLDVKKLEIIDKYYKIKVNEYKNKLKKYKK